MDFAGISRDNSISRVRPQRNDRFNAVLYKIEENLLDQYWSIVPEELGNRPWRAQTTVLEWGLRQARARRRVKHIQVFRLFREARKTTPQKSKKLSCQAGRPGDWVIRALIKERGHGRARRARLSGCPPGIVGRRHAGLTARGGG